MAPVLQIGPFSLNFPAFIILLSLYIGVSLSEKGSLKHGIRSEKLFNLFMVAVGAGLIGARFTYALRFLDIFLDNPLAVLSPSLTMLDLPGGILTAVLAGWIYSQRNEMPLFHTLDALTPVFLVLAVGIGFSRLASGDGYGSPTSSILGIYLWGETRFPTQIFEILLAMITAFLLWPQNPFIHQDFLNIPGVRLLSLFTLAGFSHLLVEPFRGEIVFSIGGLRLPQILSFGFLLLLIILTTIRIKEHFKSMDPSRKEGTNAAIG